MTARTTRRARIAAVVLALLVVLGAPSVAAQSVLNASSTVTSPRSVAILEQLDREPPPLRPELIDVESVTSVVGPGGVVELAVSIPGAPPGATLTLDVHDRVGGRILFHRSLAGEGLGRVLRTYPDLPVDGLPTDGDGIARLAFEVVEVPDGSLTSWPLPREGVYPVALSVHDVDGEVLDELVIHVVRLPSAADTEPPVPFAVAVALELDAPVALRPDGSSVLDPEVVAGVTRMVDALESVPDASLSVVPVPETVVALGRLDEASGDALVNRLADALAGRQTVAGPYVPLNVAAWIAEQQTDEVDRQLEAGSVALDTWIGTPARRSTWIVDPTLDGPALDFLSRRGITQVVVPDELLAPLDPTDFPVTLTQRFDLATGTGATLPAVQAETTISRLILEAPSGALATNRAVSDLAVLALDVTGISRGAVVILPGGADTPENLAGLLGALDDVPGGSAPLLRSTSIDTLFDTVSSARIDGGSAGETLLRTWEGGSPPRLGALPQLLEMSEARVATFASMVTPDVPGGPSEAAELLLVTPASTLAPEDRRAYFDAVDALVREGLDVVTLGPQGSVTLTAREAVVPVAIDNSALHPVQVVIDLTSEKLEFPDGSRLEIELDPGDTRLEVRVRARASGTFPVDVVVLTPDETAELAEARFTVRSTAFSGLGLVLSGAAGLFLALWWARNIRSTRRRRDLIDTPHPSRRDR